MKFGLYHSLYEWFNPLYLHDKANNFQTQEFVTKKILPEMKELIETYEPHVLWSDGDWEANDTYWKSQEFLAWLYNDSPVKDYVVTNDRWGSGIPCHHGDFYTCTDRYNPGIFFFCVTRYFRVSEVIQCYLLIRRRNNTKAQVRECHDY